MLYYRTPHVRRDKTSDLQNQTLAVVTFQHVPASYRLTAKHVATEHGDGTSGFSGLEVQVSALSSPAPQYTAIRNYFDTEVYFLISISNNPEEMIWGRGYSQCCLVPRGCCALPLRAG